MLKKGRKREAKSLAVLYFIIGLIVLALILGVIYFVLVTLDYSDKIKDPDATMRSYVETTPIPSAEVSSDSLNDTLPDSVDMTSATPTPTAEPTPTPTAEPTPEPTPIPTSIPSDLLAKPKTNGFSVPNVASQNGVYGITDCYVSQADNNQIMSLTGYGYVNDITFDGTQARSFLVVTQKSSGKMIAYQMTNTFGASEMDHTDTTAQNPGACDFTVNIDVSQYTQDIYSLALVLAYKTPSSSKITYAYFPFSSDVSFTVVGGQVVTPVTTIDESTVTTTAASDSVSEGANLF